MRLSVRFWVTPPPDHGSSSPLLKKKKRRAYAKISLNHKVGDIHFFFTTKWNSAASLSRELLGNVRVEETIDRARIFKTW